MHSYSERSPEMKIFDELRVEATIPNLVMVYRANAIVRIRGLRFSAFFEEFVLSERSEEFMEVE